MGKTVINVKKLQKNYGDNEVLKNISLNIEEGDIYGLIGRSGTGKSTLLRCMNGLTDFQNGELNVNGHDINKLDNKELRNIQKDMGMIFQDFSLITQKTVYENIALPMRHWGYSKQDIDSKVKELSEIVGITDKLNDYPGSLSGGQQQRVGIARALTLDPKIILSDEATSALDPVTTKSILKLLARVNKELDLTMVIVTHEINVIKSLCNKTAILEHGEIVVDGYTQEIFMEEPDALQRLTSIDKIYEIDSSRVRLKIKLYEYNKHEAIISDISQETGISLAIKDFKVDQLQDQHSGYIIVEMEHEELKEIERVLNSKEIEWEMD